MLQPLCNMLLALIHTYYIFTYVVCRVHLMPDRSQGSICKVPQHSHLAHDGSNCSPMNSHHQLHS